MRLTVNGHLRTPRVYKNIKALRDRITELEARIDGARAFVELLDGLPGCQMWGIKTSVLAALRHE